ncbi:MAG: STAS domain-containing protein [Clostridia bacterium]|nr:STAS domain-containing protein [Clostridia bacterium]
MEIVKKNNGNEFVFEVSGKIDTDTAPELEKNVVETLESNSYITGLVIDVANVIYLSSAGLRTLLSIQKRCNSSQKSMVIKNANETLKEVFEITGFINFLNVE